MVKASAGLVSGKGLPAFSTAGTFSLHPEDDIPLASPPPEAPPHNVQFWGMQVFHSIASMVGSCQDQTLTRADSGHSPLRSRDCLIY